MYVETQRFWSLPFSMFFCLLQGKPNGKKESKSLANRSIQTNYSGANISREIIKDQSSNMRGRTAEEGSTTRKRSTALSQYF